MKRQMIMSSFWGCLHYSTLPNQSDFHVPILHHIYKPQRIKQFQNPSAGLFFPLLVSNQVSPSCGRKVL